METLQPTESLKVPPPRPSAAAFAEKLAAWPLAELKALRSGLDTLIAERAEAARAQALVQIKELAASNGLSSEDVAGLFGRRPKRARRGVLPPKYREPESGQTWSGRGVLPSWMKTRIERDGMSKEDFLIDPPVPESEPDHLRRIP